MNSTDLDAFMSSIGYNPALVLFWVLLGAASMTVIAILLLRWVEGIPETPRPGFPVRIKDHGTRGELQQDP